MLKKIQQLAHFFLSVSDIILTFVALSEGDTGSAGEQPVSNKIVNGKSPNLAAIAAFFEFFLAITTKKVVTLNCTIRIFSN